MCKYCEKTENEHFICGVCGDGMCDECYDLNVEHTEHIQHPLELCETEEEEEMLENFCNGDIPDYLCFNCFTASQQQAN